MEFSQLIKKRVIFSYTYMPVLIISRQSTKGMKRKLFSFIHYFYINQLDCHRDSRYRVDRGNYEHFFENSSKNSNNSFIFWSFKKLKTQFDSQKCFLSIHVKTFSKSLLRKIKHRFWQRHPHPVHGLPHSENDEQFIIQAGNYEHTAKIARKFQLYCKSLWSMKKKNLSIFFSPNDRACVALQSVRFITLYLSF